MVTRYDYWTVPEADLVRQSCGQLLWDAKTRHVAGELTFAAKPVSPIEWDRVRLHLCTKPARMRAVSTGPILPIFPMPVPIRLEGSSEPEELGLVVLNLAASRPIRLEPAKVRLRAGDHDFALQGFTIGSDDCTRSLNPSPPALDLEPGALATLCFERPRESVERLQLELLPDRPALVLERDRGTFLFVLE